MTRARGTILNTEQTMCLMAIGKPRKRGMYASRIAHDTGMTQSATYNMLMKFENLRFIERTQGHHCIEVEFTELGRELYKLIFKAKHLINKAEMDSRI